jgi:pilus assembly protein CpaC
MKLFRLFSLVLSLALTAFLFSVALADDGGSAVEVSESGAEVVAIPAGATNIVPEDKAIAGVVTHKGKKASIVGKKTGKTRLTVMKGDEVIGTMNVAVNPGLSGIKRSIRSLLPNENIGVEMVNHTVALTGVASNAEAAARAVKIADEFINNDSGKHPILNLMQIRSGQQVMLKVKVGEMKRAEIQKLGLGLQAIVSGGEGFFGALEGNGAFKTLAEPTLTAISGESAKFLAGGEFPVPVAQGNNTMSVDYKKFGVSVDFAPVVISEKRVRLSVASEVSELSDVGAVKMNKISIPAISTRRANTTIELAPGESFMIAGLIKNNTNAELDQVPGLGNIPILNVLFRSAEFKRHETELVIAVTPYMANPVDAKDLKFPADSYSFPSMMEMFMLGKMQGSASNGQKSGLEGPSGFTID